MRRYTARRSTTSTDRLRRGMAQVALAGGLLLVAATTTTTASAADPTVDVDGDGFSAAAGDCSALDPGVGPHAADLPDLGFRDSDCDGVDGDASAAVFAAPDGSDANPGTQAQPVQTLTQAVALAAAGGKQVYAAVGTYSRVVLQTTHDGIQIFGGYQRGASWTRTSSLATTVQGQPEAVLADNATDVVLQLLDLEGTRGTGLSAYGLRAVNGSKVALVASTVSSGPGGSGSAGSSGFRPSKASNGDPGDIAPSCDSSGAGGTGTQFGSGTDGGAGGQGGEETNDGENGAAGTKGAGTGGGAPGDGGVDTFGDASPAGHGSPGSMGSPGSPGMNGGGGGNDLGAAGATWAGRSGGNGTDGGAGYGGGGGGGGAGNGAWHGWGAGSGGGQGGEGGAGGTRGFGGGWGGASVGVYLYNSQVLLSGTEVTAGNGGMGGTGGSGGDGAQGGDGGAGGAARTDCGMPPGRGGDGGPGGPGGDGGDGGGGSGGPSAAVMRIGTSNAQVVGTSTLDHGTGGAAGIGGAAVSGQSGDVLPAGASAVADFDGDAITDTGDACPTTPRGAADANADGCPEPPSTSLTSGPTEGSFVLSTAAQLTFSSSESGSTFTCSVDDQAGVPCDAGSLSLSGLSEQTHLLRVWARDGAGDPDASAAARRWTVPRNNTALTHGSGWTRKTGTGYYLGTYSQSTKLGATLSTTVSDMSKLALVATRGRGFGTVKVYLGSSLLKKVSLGATSTQKKRLIPIATFTSPASGKVKVVVATGGKTVRIEGLGVATG